MAGSYVYIAYVNCTYYSFQREDSSIFCSHSQETCVMQNGVKAASE